MQIVLVVLSNFQDYVLENIFHMKQMNNHDIVVLCDEKFSSLFPDYVQVFSMESLLENYTMMVDMYQKDFRNGFWHWTSFRFYAILSYMKKYNITNIVHVENDVMIFQKVDNIYFHRNDRILLTMDSKTRCVAGFMYIPNHNVLEQALYQFNHKQNDMQNWASIYNIPNQPLVDTLPIAPRGTVSCTEIPELISNSYEHYQSIFDAASMGQYVGGIDPRNSDKSNTKGFINQHCAFPYHNYKFIWLYDGESKCKCPYLQVTNEVSETRNIKINNLHVHCKMLSQFIHSRVNPNTERITGELIQETCDVYLGSHKSDFTNPYIKSLLDFDRKSLVLDDIHVLSKIKRVRSVFTFTHTITKDMFRLCTVLKEIETPFVLVCHNSDDGLTEKQGNALLSQCKNLKRIYSQNLTFCPTSKMRPLPIGLANRMWTHGNQDVWKKISIQHSKKSQLLYYYCDVNTNKDLRGDMCNILKEKGLRMQPRVNYEDYINILQSCKYAICPEGNGVDTHRFWECLYLKTVPICIRNPLVEYYSHFFPIILLERWEDFHMHMLTSINYNELIWNNTSMLYMEYYEKQIHQISTKYALTFQLQSHHTVVPIYPCQKFYNENEVDVQMSLSSYHLFCQSHELFFRKHKQFMEKHKDNDYGFKLWKSYLIYYVLETVLNDGDILLWFDDSLKFHIDSHSTWEALWQQTYCKQLLGYESDMVEIQSTKRDLFVYMEMDQSKEVYDSLQRKSDFILICKTKKTTEMIDQWNKMTTHINNYYLIDNSPGIHLKRGAFRNHNHDQSMFSLLTKKYKLFDKIRKKYVSCCSESKFQTCLYIGIPTITLSLENSSHFINGGYTFGIPYKNQLQEYNQYILNGDEHKYTNGQGLPNIIDGDYAPKYSPETQFIFSIVRNPYEMLYLLYKNKFGKIGDHPLSIKYINTFEEFIVKYCDNTWPYPGGFPCPYLKKSLYAQLYDNENKPIVHMIIIYEHLSKGLQFLQEMIPSMNISNSLNNYEKSDYELHYTEHMKQLVQVKCAKELERFDYSFEGHHGRFCYMF